MVSNRIQRKHLTATVSRTSTTTLADVTEFTFTLEAGGIYMLHGMINFKSEPAGIKQAYRGTATTTGFVMAHLTNNTIQTYTDIDNAPTSVDISTSLTNSSEAIHGIVNVGATAGTLVYRFAQNTSNATSTSLFTGSYLTLTKLN